MTLRVVELGTATNVDGFLIELVHVVEESEVVICILVERI